MNHDNVLMVSDASAYDCVLIVYRDASLRNRESLPVRHSPHVCHEHVLTSKCICPHGYHVRVLVHQNEDTCKKHITRVFVFKQCGHIRI